MFRSWKEPWSQSAAENRFLRGDGRDRRGRPRRSRLERLEVRQLLAREVTGTLVADETWSGTIEVVNDLRIARDVTVTVEPGTVVKFRGSGFIEAIGTIDAIGTATDPIVFTSVNDDTVGEDLTPGVDGVPQPGDWRSMILLGGDSTLTHVDVRYAGRLAGEDGITINETVAGTDGRSVSLSDVRVSDAQFDGIDVVRGKPTLTNVTLVDNGGVAINQAFAGEAIYDNVTATGNDGGDHVRLIGGTVTTDRVWDFGGLPAHLFGDVSVRQTGSLTIAPGSVIKVNNGFIQDNGGTIIAEGTATAPIVFTSVTDDTVGGDSNADGDATAPERGDWRTLYLYSGNSSLAHVDIRYAGRFSGEGGVNIDERFAGVDGRSASLSHVRISDSGHGGIEVSRGKPTFTDVVLVDNGGVAINQAFAAEPIYDGVVAINNAGGDHVRLVGGTVTTDRVWDFDGLPAHLIGNVSITATGSLTIAPGSIIKVDGGFIQDNGGPLIAQGSADAPIVFTSVADDTIGGDSNADGDATAATPGDWRSLYLYSGNSSLAHVEVRYAGTFSNEQGITIDERFAGVDGRSASLADVRVSDSLRGGINILQGKPTFANVVLVDNGGVAVNQAFASEPIYDGVTAIGNAGGDHIRLVGGTITTVRVWDFGGLPAHLTSNVAIGLSGSLTVVPGSVIKFAAAAFIQDNGGPLIAEGTVDAPIVFTSFADDTVGGDSNADGDATLPKHGDWRSLYLYSGDSSLANVEVRYAGTFSSEQGITIDERFAGVDGRSVSLTNVRVTESQFGGVGINQGKPTFDNVSVVNNSGIAFIQAFAAEPIYNDVTARGNEGGDRVHLAGGTISTDRVWDFGGLPAHLTGNVTIGGTGSLTIVPGSVIKIGTNLFINDNGGPLIAEGTADAPIIFTSIADDTAGGDSNADGNATLPAPGIWRSLFLYSGDSSLAHVDVRYAGAFSEDGITIDERFAGVDGRSVTLTDVRVTNSLADGIGIRTGSPELTRVQTIASGGIGIDVTSGSLTLVDSDILGGTQGVRVRAAATASGTGNSFVGQSQFGVFHDGTDRTRALFTENYWGHPGGPHDPSAGDGLVNDNPPGTPVSDFVDYGSFLSIPPRPLGPTVASFRRLPRIETPIHHRYDAEANYLDHSGTRNGAPIGNAHFGPGRDGGLSFAFDGDDVIDLGAWAPARDWTIAAWVQPTQVAATGRTMITGISNGPAEWNILIQDGNYATSTPATVLDSGVAAEVGVWTHVAATVRGTQTLLFINGSLVGTQERNGVYAPSSVGVRIGGNAYLVGATPFIGLIDEVSIVERSVSDAEIISLRDSGTIDFVPPIDRLQVRFDSAIDPSSVQLSDFSLAGPAAVGISGFEFVGTDSVVLTLSTPLTNAGSYVLSVGPDILGSIGIAMDQDRDGTPGEPIDDVFGGTLIVDLRGPRITSQTPATTTSSVLSSVTVTFDKAIDPDSFSAADVRLYNDDQAARQDAHRSVTIAEGLFDVRAVEAIDPVTTLAEAIAVLDDVALQSASETVRTDRINYGDVAGNFVPNRGNPEVATDNQFVLDVTTTINIPVAGQWTFAVGSDDGHRLQIGDFAGEFVSTRSFATDLYMFDFPAAGTYPMRLIMFQNTSSSGLELSAAQGELTSFDPDLFRLVGDSTLIEAGVRPLGVTPTDDTNTTFRVQFPPQPFDGDYELRIQPAARDVSGNTHDQNNNGVGGEAADVYVSTITVDRQPLRIISQSPSGTQVGALQSLDVTFNVPITQGSFSTGDVRITGPAGVVPATSIDRLSDTTYRINLTRSTADGVYNIIVGPGITDVGGTLMNADGDAIAGEVDDRYVSTLTVTGAGPFVTDLTPRGVNPAPLSSVTVRFSEAVDLSSFTAADVVITGPDGIVPVTGITFDGTLSYTLSFAPQTTSGVYSIAIGPAIVDVGGTAMDQDQDGTAGEPAQDVFTGMFTIDSGGPKVLSYTPDFVSRPYAFIDIVFDEDIDLSTFTPQDVSMVGPNGVVPVSQVVGMDMNKVRISFATQTTLGDYSLVIGPDIFDPSGNAMNQDGDEVFGEADEDTFTATVTFAAPDLTIDSFTVPTSAQNGDVVRIEWTVQNDGLATAAQPWTDRIVLSQDDVYGNSGDIELGRVVRRDDLVDGETYTAFIDVAIPFGIQDDYFILIRTDSAGQVFESSDVNNTTSRPITIALADPPADLIVDAITTPATGFIGDSIDVTWRVRNDGTATTIATTWVDRVYLSSDTDFGSDILLGSVTHNGSLGSNASYTMTNTFVVPASVAAGNYFVIVQTDATNRVIEPTAEGNNITSSTASIAISTAPLPDLVASGVTLSGATPAISGEVVTVNWTIANDGDKTATTDWTDAIYLSTDDVFSDDDVLLGELSTADDLIVGGSIARSANVRLPDAVSGNHHFIVVPDANNNVNEGAGEDTVPAASDAVEVSLFPYADLTVSQVVAPELLVGDPVDLTVSWTVQNVGAGPGRVHNWTDRVILSNDDILGDADDIVLGTYTHVGAMPVGSQYTRTEIIQLANRTNGRFTLFVQTDADDAVFELADDATNVGSPGHFVDVSRTPYSDLVVESVTTSGDPVSGQPIGVSWTVRNNADRGIATTDRDTWTDFVYISPDPTGATGLRLIGSSTRGGALALGGSYTRVENFVLPRTTEGQQYVFVRTGGPNEFLYNSNTAIADGSNANPGGGNQAVSEPIDVFLVPPPNADLVVADVSVGGATEFADGTQVEVTWTIRNEGETTETGWRDRLFLQSTAGNETYQFGKYAVDEPIAAGTTVTRTEVVLLPRTSGQFRFFVETDTDDVIFETDNVLNTGFTDPFQINLRARPDLQVTVQSDYPAAITAGTLLPVEFRVRNLGTADTPSAGSRWKDRVWLSSSSSSTAGALLLGELDNGSALGFPGSPNGLSTEYVTTASFLIPRAISGNWFVLVETDARSQVDEFPSENNNRAAKAVAIDANPVPPPDLVVTSIQGPGDTFDDSSFTVRYAVSNLGAGPTDPGSWTDQIWLTLGTDGPKPGRGDRLVGTYRHSGVLEVNDSYEAEATVNIPVGLTGQYFLTVYADGYGRVYEASFASNVNPDAPGDLDGSNYGSTPINVLLTPPADLRVSTVTVPAGDDGNSLPIVGGETLSLSWTVDNIGTAATDRESWADAIYISEDDVWDPTDQLVFALPHVGRLLPGQSYTQDAEFTLPPTARGNHVLVRTNVDPRIALTDEDKFLDEVKAVLQRVEAATGKPLGETSLSDLRQFSQSELRAILAGPTRTLATVYEGPFTDNNVGSTDIPVTDAVTDLVVETVTATPTSKSGEPITVRWTIANDGDHAVAADTDSVTQYVFLSKDQVYDASRDFYVGAKVHLFNQPLGPGESFSDSLVVATPPGSSGTWYAHVFTNVGLSRGGNPILNRWSRSSFPHWVSDLQDKPWEDGNKDNNFRVSNPIAVEYAEADLTITNLTAIPVDPDSGSLLSVSFTVTNSGTRATRVDDWTDRVFLSTDTSTDAYDIELGRFRRRDALGIAESYEVSMEVRVPDNIGGDFNLIAFTDATFGAGSYGRPLPYPATTGPTRSLGIADKVLEFDGEGNNQVAIPLDVQFVPAPDLVLDSLTHTLNVDVGEDFTFTYVYSNDGGAVPDRQTPYFDRVYLSRDRFLDVSSDHFVREIGRIDPLAASETGSITQTVRVPRGLVGDYYVIVATDVPRASRADGEVLEADETNNVIVGQTPMLIVLPPPSDLQVVDVSASASGQVGDISSVTWTVENTGDERARARIADAVYLSADNVWDVGDLLLGRVDPLGVRTLNPGETYTSTLDFEIPATLPGDYRVIVRTDIFDDVFEGENNRNNDLPSAGTINVTVPLLRLDIPLADQLAVGVSRLFQLDTSPGQTIRVGLDSLNNVGSHELYAKHEALPRPFDFDAAYEGYLAADQTLVIPETLGGRYFILARAGIRVDAEDDVYDPSTRNEYPVELTASRLPFGITGVTPDAGGDDRYVTVTISGAEFPPQAAVRLVRPTIAEFAPVSVTRVDATEIIAVFDLARRAARFVRRPSAASRRSAGGRPVSIPSRIGGPVGSQRRRRRSQFDRSGRDRCVWVRGPKLGQRRHAVHDHRVRVSEHPKR